jgi:hypothetical protein
MQFDINDLVHQQPFIHARFIYKKCLLRCYIILIAKQFLYLLFTKNEILLLFNYQENE